jgi:peptide/nickel transport system substrate-binding protein
MLESFEPGRRTVLVRNPDWWGWAEYQHDIDRIVWTVESDPERRLALLVGGETDFLHDPPLDRLDQLRGAPGIKLARISLLATELLGLDQGSAELRTSDVKGRNPFADHRVRQAVYQGIDIERLIAKQGGLGEPAGMVAAPGTNGYNPELDRRLPHDPGRARALLSEAGYPDGFSVRLDCPPQRRQSCEEVATQLTEVGLRVTADVQPFEVYRQRLASRATDFYVTLDYAGMTLDSAELFHDLYYHAHPHWVNATLRRPVLRRAGRQDRWGGLETEPGRTHRAGLAYRA